VDVACKLRPHGEYRDGVADLLEDLMAKGDGHRVALVGELWRANGFKHEVAAVVVPA
jgi:hypothetical protein